MRRWLTLILSLCLGLTGCLSSGPPAPASPTPPDATATTAVIAATTAAPPAATTATPTPTATLPAQLDAPVGPDTPLPETQPLTAANAAGLRRLAVWPQAQPDLAALAFSTSGRSLWAASAAHAWAWRARDGVLIRTVDGPALSYDGQLALQTIGLPPQDADVARKLAYVLRDAASGAEVTRWTDAKPIDVSGCAANACALLRFAPDNGTVAEIEDLAAGTLQPVLKVWRLDGTRVWAAPGVQAFVYSPDGQLLVSRRTTAPPIDIWRVADGALLKSLAPGFTVNQMTLSPENARLALAGEGRVQVWRWPEGALEQEVAVAGVTGLAFNADGTVLAVSAVDGVRLFGVADGVELAALPTGADALAGAPDGRWLVVGTEAGLELWGVPAGYQAAAPTEPSPTGVAEPATAVPALKTTDRPQVVLVYLILLEDAGRQGVAVGCGDSAVPVESASAPTQAVLRAAVDALLSIKQANYAGLYNAWAESAVTLENVDLREGVATLSLSGALRSGGACDHPRLIAQLRQTALQFPTVRDVIILVNGRRIEDVLAGR